MTERADFLTRMVDRALEQTPVVEPRELSRFETRRSSAMQIEPLESTAEETAFRASVANARVHEVNEAGLRGTHRELRDARALADAEPRYLRTPPTEEPAHAGSHAEGTSDASEASETVWTPAQTRAHRATHEQQPTLIPRIAVSLPRPEVAEPVGDTPARTYVDDSRTPVRRQVEPSPSEELPRPSHDVAATPSRTESLLPKHPLVSDVVARAADSPSPSRDPSTTRPESAADTVVQVTIGRVEVRASTPQSKAAAPVRRSNTHQPMTLTEYLQKRGSSR